VLAGAGVRQGVGELYGDASEPQDTGHFHLAVDPERTVGRDRFAAVLDGLLAELRAIPPSPGFNEVLVPGDPEDRARDEREHSGIPIEPALWSTLRALSLELGVDVPE
jgi:LDH2 family malate/lactate/ureidoglycolate dehydrogenase